MSTSTSFEANKVKNPPEIIGFWTLETARMRLEDGVWIDEVVYGGSSAFTDTKVCAFVRTSEGPFGYTGSYSLDGDQIFIITTASIVPEYEGNVLRRTLKLLPDNRFLFAGVDINTGRHFELVFKR